MLICCLVVTVIVANTLAATAPCTPCALKATKLEQILDVNEKNLRRASEDSPTPAEARRTRRCCPYDFDSRLCQIVNDRVLCGFNKNVGRPENNAVAVTLSGGCRLRGERLECGYEQGPYSGIRRPPAWNGGGFNEISEHSGDTPEGYDEEYVNRDNKQRLVLNKGTKKPKLKAPVTKCVEVKDRIVCKAVEK